MTNPKITALIQQLANGIETDAAILQYRADRSKFYDDMELMQLMNEYNSIQNKLEGEGLEEKEAADYNAKAQELSTKIYANKTYVELQESENKINTLLNMVNDAITTAITGEEQGSCGSGGGCSGCGGGCH